MEEIKLEDGLFSAEVLADSIYQGGPRLTTMAITFPRSILAELNTWRMKSSNSVSSRAVPASKTTTKVLCEPYIPQAGKNQSGMQQAAFLNEEEMKLFIEEWLGIRDFLVSKVEFLSDPKGLNIHKGVTNRLIEPFMYITVIVTATDWDNMFAQRTDAAAEINFQKIATMMYRAMKQSKPRFVYRRTDLSQSKIRLATGAWTLNAPMCNHLPLWWNERFDETLGQLNTLTHFVVSQYLENYDNAKGTKLASKYGDYDFDEWLIRDIVAGRAAKVSYDNLETGRVDVLNDIRLSVQLRTSQPLHGSPFEHIATPAEPQDMTYSINQLRPVLINNEYNMSGNLLTSVGIAPKPGEIGYCANLKGWKSYRKEFYGETITEFEMEDND